MLQKLTTQCSHYTRGNALSLRLGLPYLSGKRSFSKMFFKSEEFEAPPGFSVRLEGKHFETELFETDGVTSINI